MFTRDLSPKRRLDFISLLCDDIEKKDLSLTEALAQIKAAAEGDYDLTNNPNLSRYQTLPPEVIAAYRFCIDKWQDEVFFYKNGKDYQIKYVQANRVSTIPEYMVPLLMARAKACPELFTITKPFMPSVSEELQKHITGYIKVSSHEYKNYMTDVIFSNIGDGFYTRHSYDELYGITTARRVRSEEVLQELEHELLTEHSHYATYLTVIEPDAFLDLMEQDTDKTLEAEDLHEDRQ